MHFLMYVVHLWDCLLSCQLPRFYATIFTPVVEWMPLLELRGSKQILLANCGKWFGMKSQLLLPGLPQPIRSFPTIESVMFLHKTGVWCHAPYKKEYEHHLGALVVWSWYRTLHIGTLWLTGNGLPQVLLLLQLVKTSFFLLLYLLSLVKLLEPCTATTLWFEEIESYLGLD